MDEQRKVFSQRHFSIQTDQPRGLLRKQFSIDLTSKEPQPPEKQKQRPSKQSKKLACSERRQTSLDNPRYSEDNVEDVVVKKCKEQKRPATAKPKTKSNLLEKDTILYTRQELAERLRKAWLERERGKQNLNIFLACNVKEKHEEDEKSDSEINSQTVETPKAKILTGADNSNKNVFQKQILRKEKALRAKHDIFVEPCVNPLKNGVSPQDIRTNISFDDGDEPSWVPESSTEPKPTPEGCNSVILRPLAAASRREETKPLVRTLSVPTRNDKPKFIATKRRVKTAKKKRDENDFLGEINIDDAIVDGKKGRCKSASRAEMVTMVSLVSPAGSDTEENCDKSKAKKVESPVKAVACKDQQQLPKNTTLRKTIKSVTFQQSSIHAVRSFSACLPSRRLMMAEIDGQTSTSTLTEREKRAPIEQPSENVREAKRRLVKMQDENLEESSNKPSIEERPGTLAADASVPEKLDNSGEFVNEDAEEDEPIFENAKERQCWAAYKKMSEKGLNVSFDTILRGMLTPTEYRQRKKHVPRADSLQDCLNYKHITVADGDGPSWVHSVLQNPEGP